MTYEFAKFVHVTGVAMLMGNVTVTAIWKFFADRDGRPTVLAFSQKLVTYTDWAMTFWGAIFILGGGYYMTRAAGIPLTQRWLLWSQLLFFGAGFLWIFVLVPIQVNQARLARGFTGVDAGDFYRTLSKKWLLWGVISTIPLVAATWLMIDKPL